MDEQTQAEFIQWLSEQLQIESPEDLQAKLEEIGDEGIKQAFQLFNKQKQQGSVGAFLEGGKLDYLKCLKQHKLGGKLGCGCKKIKSKR